MWETPTASHMSSIGRYTTFKVVSVPSAKEPPEPSESSQSTTTTHAAKEKPRVAFASEVYYAPLATDSWRTCGTIRRRL